MNRKEIVLVAMTPARGAAHTPVQIQKLLFLIDRNIAQFVDGPHFHFEAYSYGPFDKEVYRTLEELEEDGLVVIDGSGHYRTYCLTVAGQTKGEELFGQLDDNIQTYITKLSNFVRRLRFSELVRAIYKAYPEMKANSVFVGA